MHISYQWCLAPSTFLPGWNILMKEPLIFFNSCCRGVVFFQVNTTICEFTLTKSKGIYYIGTKIKIHSFI